MCNCLQAVNDSLPKGVHVETGFAFGPDGEQSAESIAIHLIGPDGKKPRAPYSQYVIPTYCPFCGIKYQEAVQCTQ